jgi:glucose/mannose-6-phosphate isomerase
VDLDDPQRFGEVDSRDALGDVERAAQQWRDAHARADVRLDLAGADAVLVTGMGGSGVTGDVIAALAAAARFPLPVAVHKGYGLPHWAGPRTVVVAVSYSGETEETRSGVDEALARGCRVFAVASGGAVGAACDAHRAPWVQVPGGGMPRHSTGWLLVPVLVALGLDHGVDEAVAQLDEVAARYGRAVPSADNLAKRLGAQLAGGAVPLVWGGSGLGALAAYRLKCQLNENAKLIALAAELPEANHNEVVAWQEQAAGASGVLFVRDLAGEHPRLAARFAATTRLVAERAAWVAELHACGDTPLARLASLLVTADLASIYAALALDRDPTPIPFIDRLKAELANQ